MKEAIVLAGGLGTRLRSVVSEVAKPMAPIHGKPFLAHLLDYWIGQGIGRFILSVGYRWESIESFFGGRYRGAVIDYAVESAPQGTGGGLAGAQKKIASPGPILVINGDTFFAVGGQALADFHQSHAGELTVALSTVTKNTRYGGVSLTADSRIANFRVKSELGVPSKINGGVYLFERSLLDFLGQVYDRGESQILSLESDFFPLALAKGKAVYGFPTSGIFVDIGVPEDYRAASALFIDSGTKASDNT